MVESKQAPEAQDMAIAHQAVLRGLETQAARIRLIPGLTSSLWGPALAGKFAGPEVLERAPAFVDTLAETLSELYRELPDDITEDRRFSYALFLAVCSALPKGPAFETEGPLSLEFGYSDDYERVQLYRGDLHVRGNFEFARDVLVMGDLTVDGVLRDTYEHMSLLVNGSIRANAIGCGHKLWSGGSVDSEVVAVTRYGTIYAEKGINARLVVADTAESALLSRVNASVYVDGQTMFGRPAEGLDRLRQVLQAHCFEESTEDSFEPGPLLDAMAAGKAVFSSH
jgi:hypothetical protein